MDADLHIMQSQSYANLFQWVHIQICFTLLSNQNIKHKNQQMQKKIKVQTWWTMKMEAFPALFIFTVN